MTLGPIDVELGEVWAESAGPQKFGKHAVANIANEEAADKGHGKEDDARIGENLGVDWSL